MPVASSPRPRPVRRSLVESLDARRLFAFGVTAGTAATGQSTYVVDNGGDLKFAIIKGGSVSSTLHMADLSSLQYKGKELLAPYSTTSRYSHYEQGLGGNTIITTATGGVAGSRWILVTCDDSNEASGGVIQYYGARENDNNLYLLSLPTDVNNGPGEGRFLAYLNRSVFTTPELPSDNAPHSASDVVSTIEGGDVFGHTDGASTVQTTSSKFFNMGRRMIDNVYHGLTGSAGGTSVGAWMYMGNREHSAGGPFMKDIDYQSSDAVELYNCIFTGHTQTESYRQGLHTYALQLTGGAAPTTPDYSWLEAAKDNSGNFLVQGLIPASGRGTLTGTATGRVSGHQTVVGLSNGTAQYWAYANASTGAYTIPGIQPGTYTETLYDNELEVGAKTVTITAGKTTAANIANTFYVPSNPVFRIGTWDGTPIGFLNTEVADVATGARKIEIMHPSDVRMTAWNSTPNFVVGTNTDAQWPAYQFMGVNNNQRITFNLTSAQVQNLTLRIGITWGFSGARPKITVNSGQTYAWTSANPSASSDLNSRGITRGTWRGDNQLYTFGIPASAFRAGTNTIDVPLISGSYTAGQTWLSPNVSYDAIDLVPTTSATPATIGSVALTPANATATVGTSKAYAAIAKDSAGNVLPVNLDWSTTLGTIDANGNYVAPTAAGTGTVTAAATRTRTPGYSTSSTSTSSFGSVIAASGTTNVTVVNATVAGRSTFYNNSKFDGNDANANAADDNAIATDKTALLPGQTATFSNYTSYSRGINGVIVDVANLASPSITAADFTLKVGNSNDPSTWAIAPAPTNVLVRPGAGANGSTRIELVWADNAIQKQWLQLTLLADALTGLAANDVFYFGNAIGETGDGTAATAIVNGVDEDGVRNNGRSFLNPAPITFAYDIDRDGLVNGADVAAIRANPTSFLNALKFITVPATPVAVVVATGQSTTAAASKASTLAATTTTTTKNTSTSLASSLTITPAIATKRK